jgi:hypothetical protein
MISRLRDIMVQSDQSVGLRMILALLVVAGTLIFSYGNFSQKSKMMTKVVKQMIKGTPNKFRTTVLRTTLSTVFQFTDQKVKNSNLLFMLRVLTNLSEN